MNKNKKYKKYKIHDNGGTPFVVHVSDTDDEVYIINNETGEIIKHYKTKKVFIGKSPKCKMTVFSKGYGKSFYGNTVLLHLSSNKYVFVCRKILEFTTDNDEIIDYVSPVGNSDVPYPVAMGKKYIYSFATDKKGYIKIEDIGIYNLKNIDELIDELFKYEYFFVPFKKSKNEFKSSITINDFKKIMSTNVNQIKKQTFVELCKIFKITSNGSKSELIYKLETVGHLKFAN